MSELDLREGERLLALLVADSLDGMTLAELDAIMPEAAADHGEITHAFKVVREVLLQAVGKRDELLRIIDRTTEQRDEAEQRVQELKQAFAEWEASSFKREPFLKLKALAGEVQE